MKIKDILSADNILVEKKALNKKQLLEKLSHLASEKTELEEEVIFNALIERERLGTTGIGRGVALPHTRLEGLKNIYCAFVKSEPMAFDSVDEKPVDLLFLLLVPENAGGDHLKALARLSRLLRNEKATEQLRAADLPKTLYKIIVDNDLDE